MGRMYQTAHKRIVWHPPIRVHHIPDSFSSELESESGHEWKVESSEIEIEVSSGSVNSGVPGVLMPEPRTKRTVHMSANPNFRFFLSESEQEKESQYEPVWDPALGLEPH
jgi:hypothetical protein